MDTSDSDTATPTGAPEPLEPTAATPAPEFEPHEPLRPTATADDGTDDETGGDGTSDDETGDDEIGDPSVATAAAAAKKRRRGSRGGKNRKRPPRPAGEDGDGEAEADDGFDDTDGDESDDDPFERAFDQGTFDDDDDGGGGEHGHHDVVGRAGDEHPELPDRISENRPSPAAAEQALVRKPQIGDTRPAPGAAAAAAPTGGAAQPGNRSRAKQTGGRNGQQNGQQNGQSAAAAKADGQREPRAESDAAKKKRRRGGKGRGTGTGTGGSSARPDTGVVEMDPDVLERRRGRERNGRPIGRYLMCVQVRPTLTQVAVLEGRNLIEHYVSRPADDVSQIHGNIYVGKVQNVLPGMEAAFVDIGTPKNAVLYRGDVQYDAEDIVEKHSAQPRIEQMLRAK
ncbi:MAG: hypothetical protein RJA49_2146, partial [Actinomycetota bacterium]